MDDKNKYNNALEKLQEALAPKDGREISGLTRGCIESIFPELAESKDDRIRKEIIEYIKTGTYHKDWIAWLEKQGEKPQGKSALEAIQEEKVDNANKVEPKFHEGEWVVWDNKISCHIDNIYQVKESLMYAVTDTNNMIRTYSGKDFDRNAHLWTIQDAKDGDVLISKAKHPFIFKNYDEDTDYVYAYCGITDLVKNNGFYINYEDDELWTMYCVNGDVLPATKEQRDILKKAMNDAGWQFDFEKKELKKVENEIEVPFSVKDSELKEENYYIPKGFYAEIDDDKVVIKKGKKPTAWSEEDEKNLKRAILYVENPALRVKDTMLSEWLKSIKERVQPQPKQEWSDEDEDAIGMAIIALEDMYDEDAPNTTYGGYNLPFNKAAERLKSLKDRVIPQSKLAWSEEDEKKIKKVMHIVSLDGRISNEECKSILDWLEFLKERYTWKPSNIQMECLHDAIEHYHTNGYPASKLTELYEQMSKIYKL